MLKLREWDSREHGWTGNTYGPLTRKTEPVASFERGLREAEKFAAKPTPVRRLPIHDPAAKYRDL